MAEVMLSKKMETTQFGSVEVFVPSRRFLNMPLYVIFYLSVLMGAIGWVYLLNCI